MWIINILEENKVPYKVSGGFAARVYGSRRKLRDIDIEIKDSGFIKINNSIKPFLIEGPKLFKDKQMRTFGCVLSYKNQIIELSGTDSELLYDIKTKKWKKSIIDLKKITVKHVYGKKVKVIKLIDWLNYKMFIGPRPEDLKDIQKINL